MPTRSRRPTVDELDAALARRRRLRRARRRRRSPLQVVAALAAVLALAGVAGGAGVLAFGSACDLDALRPVAIGQNSFVYAADGSLLGAIPAERNREPVPLARVSPWLVRATIAIEDRRFYEHGAIDPEGIARAVWANLKAREVVQGGSTITQQLVRNLYISQERTLERKATEACLAIKLDREWSKRQILSTYLNQVYYGNLAYGVEAAAQTYFSKQAADLTLAEAALLAGLTQAPSAYNPLVEPELARARRDQVLAALLESGAITRGRHDAVRRRGLGLDPGRLYTSVREPYFFGYVRDRLVEAYGAETVRSGGLRVYTTIVPRWQRLAREAIAKTLDEPDDPASALISIDSATGAIRAMASATAGRPQGEFNLVSQARRQPGSTFKTFVLTAAVDQGIDPASTYYVSAPFTYRPAQTGSCEDETWWCVRTYDSSYAGWTSIARATLRSDNTVYAQLTLDVTPAKVAAMARRLGVRSSLAVNGAFVPSMGLGTIGVSPLDMASAYATLAARGVRAEPMAIRRVVLANGKEDTEAGWGAPRRRRVISEGVAATVTRILEENVRYGTGTRAAFDRPAAGKTGTTDKHADAWFAGYTPGLATTVWVGYETGERPMEAVHGISVSGGTFPAEIWRRFMEAALAGRPPRAFPEPAAWPEWKPFQRGPHSLSYDPYAAPAPAPAAPAETTPEPSPDAGRDRAGRSGGR